MSDVKLNAYCVTLSFGGEGAPLTTNIWLAPTAEWAAAMHAVETLRKYPTEAEIVGCIAQPIELDHLRHLLRGVDGKIPEGGKADIVSLVVSEPRVQSLDSGGWTSVLRQRGEIRDQGHVARVSDPPQRADRSKEPICPGIDAAAAAAASTFTDPGVESLWRSMQESAEYADEMGRRAIASLPVVDPGDCLSWWNKNGVLTASNATLYGEEFGPPMGVGRSTEGSPAPPIRHCRHFPNYPNCSCDPVSCVMLRSPANPAGLESMACGHLGDGEEFGPPGAA